MAQPVVKRLPAALHDARVHFAAITLAGLAAAVVLYSFDPHTSRLYTPCPFHALTSLYCPGCGTLRGLHLLLRGDIAGAADSNVLMVAMLPYILYEFVSYGFFAFGGGYLPRVFRSTASIWTLLGVIIAYWVLRNVPVWPLTVLQP